MAGCMVITGASGLLGSHLCRAFAARGWQVRAGVRDPAAYKPPNALVTPFRCILPDHIEQNAFSGAGACIHAAYATRTESRAVAERINVLGTKAVLSTSRSAGIVQFVFISSCSAHADARSFYGRSKLLLENTLDPSRDLILRPGLILAEGGLFARLCDVIRSSAIIPLFGGGRQSLQTIHIDDVCLAITTSVERRLTGRHVLAEAEGIEFRELLASAAQRLGKHPLFVPLPLASTLAFLRLGELLGMPLPVSSDNLLGLTHMAHQEPSEALVHLGIQIRSARQSLQDLLGG